MDLDAIQARADAASPGPWKAEEYPDWIYDCTGDQVGVKTMWSEADVAFVVAARTDVPALLAVIGAIRQIHVTVLVRDEPWCNTCECWAPCSTIQAVDGEEEG